MTLKLQPCFCIGFAALLATGGCGRTLVFGERDGVNLAIRANTTSSPPLEVNFGLNRTVATIVPPTGQTSGTPSGEAVNMFAGFQVERFTDTAPNRPVAVDLEITSQFASGAAAKAVADSPAVVARIVQLPGSTVQRDLPFVDTIDARSALVARIKRLSDPEVVAVAAAMAPKLAERTDPTVLRLERAIPRNGRFTPANARAFLMQWAALEMPTPQFAAEWANAFADAGQ